MSPSSVPGFKVLVYLNMTTLGYGRFLLCRHSGNIARISSKIVCNKVRIVYTLDIAEGVILIV